VPVYSTTAAVRARVPYRDVTTSPLPSDAQVEAWLDETEARLDATLARAGITLVSARYAVVRPFVVDNAAGLLRMANAATGGDGENDDGKDLLKRFDDFLLSILQDPEGWALALGTAPSSGSRSRLSSYATDNADGLSTSEGHFNPVFRKGDAL